GRRADADRHLRSAAVEQLRPRRRRGSAGSDRRSVRRAERAGVARLRRAMIDLPPWIQMALSALGGTSVVGGIVIATVKAWSKRGESRAREVEAREASATAVVKPLIDRLEAQDKRIDAQGEEIEKLRKDREK